MSARFEVGLILPIGLICGVGCSVYEDSDLDPDAVSSALGVAGGNRLPGSPPPPGGQNPPVLNSAPAQVDIAPGGTARVPLQFDSGGGYDTCYAQVQGASDYFDIPDPGSTGDAVSLDLNVPADLQGQSFCVDICVAGPGGVSNIVETCFSVDSISSTCLDYGRKVQTCYSAEYEGYEGYDAAYFAGYCTYALAEASAYGESCARSMEDWFACLSRLDCAEFEQENGCQSEIDALDRDC